MTTFTPLAARIGATIGTESDPAPLGELGLIDDVLADRLVVALPDQHLDPAGLHAFMGHFGPAHVHHHDTDVVHVPDLPEVLELRKEPDGPRLFGGEGWHADTTFLDPAGGITGLSAVVVPPTGGDTLFASGIAAFAELSGAMQDLLRGLRAVHSYDGPGRPPRPGLTATHPVVRRHPVTGAEGLYTNTMFVTNFEGMRPEESRPLLEFLERHTTRPEFTCRVRWSPGQLVLWDNRFTLHYPINDFVGHARLMYRRVALEPPT